MAAPLFVGAFTAIGARRDGYDWRRHAVSSLANGDRDGSSAPTSSPPALYLTAASAFPRPRQRVVGPRLLPALVGAALVGSGVFVTDPVGGFPPAEGESDDDGPPSKGVASRPGTLHNLCAIPIFVGIPVAGVLRAVSYAKDRDYRWAVYSIGSSLVMGSSFVLFGAGLKGRPNLVAKAGMSQRISIATGFGWLSALSLRALLARDRD